MRYANGRPLPLPLLLRTDKIAILIRALHIVRRASYWVSVFILIL